MHWVSVPQAWTGPLLIIYWISFTVSSMNRTLGGAIEPSLISWATHFKNYEQVLNYLHFTEWTFLLLWWWWWCSPTPHSSNYVAQWLLLLSSLILTVWLFVFYYTSNRGNQNHCKLFGCCSLSDPDLWG